MTEVLDVVLLRERAAASLRKMIFAGRLPAGSEIAQDEIASLLGTSRMPVREAFQLLEREGALELRPHRRAVVRGFTEADITDEYEIRALVEGEAAARAASRARSAASLEQVLAEAEAVASRDDPSQYVGASYCFHRAVWECSGSRRLVVVCKQLWTGWPTYLPELVPGTVERSTEEHRGILAAIAAGSKARARGLMIEHIITSCHAFLKGYRGGVYGDRFDDAAS